MPAGFPLKFTIAVPGQEAFVTALQRFAESITDFTPFWFSYFLPTWFAYISQSYASQGGSTGSDWSPLSAAYAAWKAKRWPGQPIGVLTGRTRSSLTTLNDPNAVLEMQPQAFAVGTKLDYPIFLQLGTARMPARPPMRITQQFASVEVAKLLQKFGHDTLKAAKLGKE